MTISKEDFEAWRSNPVTEAFFLVLEEMAALARTNCTRGLWEQERLWTDGRASDWRTAAKARVECIEDIQQVEFYEEANEEPERN